MSPQYDIPELKELALRQIRQDLSKCDITEEVFSKYTSWSVVLLVSHLAFDFSPMDRYPELKELGLRQLARVLLSSEPDRAMASLRGKVKSYTRGELPHAKHVISGLYRLMESNKSVEESPLPPTVRSNQQNVDGDWAGLKKALTSSLTSGTFLDSQFYVESRSSTGPAEIRQLYFCSPVSTSFASKLMACKSFARIVCGLGIDPPSKVPQSSGPGEYPLSSQMGTTVIWRTRGLTKKDTQSYTRVFNGSSIRSPRISTDLISLSVLVSERVPPPQTHQSILRSC